MKKYTMDSLKFKLVIPVVLVQILSTNNGNDDISRVGNSLNKSSNNIKMLVSEIALITDKQPIN